MKINYILFSAFLLIFSTFSKAQRYLIPKHVQVSDYVPNQLIFKIKEDQRIAFENSNVIHPLIADIIQESGGGNVLKNFPASKVPRKKTNENGEALSDLSLIYQLKTNNNIDVRRIEEKLFKSGIIEWAQPRYITKPMFTPNDPQIAQQYHHALIKTFEAWDIEQGDTNVFIGITDAGIQFTHEDLGNVKFNYNDPINGIDDDNNGYVDDYRGWNSVSNSNDPTATLSPHGMFTTGMCSATTNNSLGIAGNAYKCKFIPIRIDDANGFNYGYEGIVYAADRGAQIINASWGNTFYTPLGEDVIRYATINLGALVIAAAGNSGLNEAYYPASYPFVLNVGATGAADVKWSGSTYGPDLDIVAPGELVWSCWPFNGYQESSGTSFSSPLVAGAAALVKSHFPQYNALQVAERLKVTADTSIYQLGGNSGFYHYLGAGRLNMLNAVNAPEIPSLHFEDVTLIDNDGNNFPEEGDIVTMNGNYFNYLAPTTSFQAIIESNSSFIDFSSNTFNGGVVATLSGILNTSQPFVFSILPNCPVNLDVVFKITYSGSGFKTFEYIKMKLNRDYIDLGVNNIKTTITSRGNVGYNADYANQGIGISYKNSETMIYSMSFMIGSSSSKTADNTYASTIPGFDNDFVRINPVKTTNPLNADFVEIQSKYFTDSASSNKLEIAERVWASTALADSNFILFNYNIKNVGNSLTENLSAGLFTDWDIQNSSTNQAVFNIENKLSYAFNTQNNGLYGGVKLISGNLGGHYCYNSNGISGSNNLYDGFSGAEKYNAVSGGQTRDFAPTGDIANLISGAINSLAPGDSAQLTFALLAAANLNDLIDAGNKAQAAFNFKDLSVQLESQNETCAGSDGLISFQTNNIPNVQVNLISSGEILVESVVNSGNLTFENLLPDNYRLLFTFQDSTTFSLNVNIEAAPIVISSISASEDTVLFSNATVQFTSSSTGAESYSWDFGDGESSIEPNPVHTFLEIGTYEVSLIAYNASCADTSSLSILVDGTVGDYYKDLSQVNVYPNPATDYFIIKGVDKGIIKIYNSFGQLTMQQNFYEGNNVLINHLSKGVYNVEISNEKLKVNKLLIIK
jgi:PKD repeat protein